MEEKKFKEIIETRYYDDGKSFEYRWLEWTEVEISGYFCRELGTMRLNPHGELYRKEGDKFILIAILSVAMEKLLREQLGDTHH